MSHTRREPLFTDLIFNEEGKPVKSTYIGQEPFYAVPDNDFLRHVEAEYVDRQIVESLQEQISAMRDTIVEGVMHMMEKEALFARASIEHAIDNMDQILEPGAVDVDELRTALWMSGFRAIVNVHGELVEVKARGWANEA